MHEPGFPAEQQDAVARSTSQAAGSGTQRVRTPGSDPTNGREASATLKTCTVWCNPENFGSTEYDTVVYYVIGSGREAGGVRAGARGRGAGAAAFTLTHAR